MTRKAKTQDEFVSATGTVFKIIEHLSNAVTDAGGSNADLRRIISDPSLTARLAGVIMEGRPVKVKPLEDLAAGCRFYYVNPDITEANFPRVLSLTTSSTPKELHFDRVTTTAEVLTDLENLGLRPATAHEAVQYAKDNPIAGLSYVIVALGSVWADPNGVGLVVCLWRVDDGRRLNLRWSGGSWLASDRFLAVCK